MDAVALDLLAKINEVRADPTDEGFDELVLMVAKLIEPRAARPTRSDEVVVRETPPRELRPSTIQRWNYHNSTE